MARREVFLLAAPLWPSKSLHPVRRLAFTALAAPVAFLKPIIQVYHPLDTHIFVWYTIPYTYQRRFRYVYDGRLNMVSPAGIGRRKIARRLGGWTRPRSPSLQAKGAYSCNQRRNRAWNQSNQS